LGLEWRGGKEKQNLVLCEMALTMLDEHRTPEKVLG
jgi:hypothetical protein